MLTDKESVLYCVLASQIAAQSNMGPQAHGWANVCVCVCVVYFVSICSHQNWKPRVTSAVNLLGEENCIVLLLLFHHSKCILTNSRFNFSTISVTISILLFINWLSFALTVAKKVYKMDGKFIWFLPLIRSKETFSLTDYTEEHKYELHSKMYLAAKWWF